MPLVAQPAGVEGEGVGGVAFLVRRRGDGDEAGAAVFVQKMPVGEVARRTPLEGFKRVVGVVGDVGEA